MPSDVGTYTYPTSGSARPPAVSSISGTISASFTYDANGNETAGETGKSLAYTSFNMPNSITEGTNTITFVHDVDHQRFKQVSPEGTTLYLAGFGIMVEKFTGSGSTVQWNEYISAGDGLVAERFNVVGGSVTTRYVHKDQLGSIAVLTDGSGGVAERDSFDAWGKRRHSDGSDDTTGSLTSQTTRGFTGHEELQDVSLVHMNGRVYDPLVGRFTSADPTVQEAFNSQGWNRYAYVQDNPLSRIDPNGYGFFSFLSHIFNPVQVFNDQISVVKAVYSVPYLGTAINIASVAAATYACGPCGIGVAAANASLEAGVTSGNIGEAFKAGVVVGAETALTQYGGLAGAALSAELGHAAYGQDFQSGFLAAGFSSAVGGVIPDTGFVGNIITSAAISGTASVIAGGKFEDGAIRGALNGAVNGAVTAAFAYTTGQINNGAPSGAELGCQGCESGPPAGVPDRLNSALIALRARIQQIGDPEELASFADWSTKYSDTDKTGIMFSGKYGTILGDTVYDANGSATIFYKGISGLSDSDLLFTVGHEFAHTLPGNHALGPQTVGQWITGQGVQQMEKNANEMASEILRMRVPGWAKDYAN